MLQRYVVELGTGADLHGANMTKAAYRAVKDAISLIKIYREMRTFGPDIVHTHTAKAGTVGRVAALIYRWATWRTLIGRPRPIRVVTRGRAAAFCRLLPPSLDAPQLRATTASVEAWAWATLLPGGTLRPGAPADIVIIDLDTPWIVDPAKLRSSCKNTPFDEARFTGGAVRTIASGRTVFQRAMP